MDRRWGTPAAGTILQELGRAAEGTTHRFVVEGGFAGTRLDVLLPRLLPELSRSRVQQLIAEGRAALNGRPASKSRAVLAGDRLELTVPPPVAATPRAEAIPLQILHEDEELLAVNKPAGMVVHPAPGHAGGTLVNALLAAVPDLSGIGGAARPGIVHRLDKGTSGVVLVPRATARTARSRRSSPDAASRRPTSPSPGAPWRRRRGPGRPRSAATRRTASASPRGRAARARQVIVLRNLEDLSHDEIAARMNRSVGAVRMLWVRALAALREKMLAP